HRVLRSYSRQLSGDPVRYLGMIGEVVHYRSRWRGQPLVPDFYNHGGFSLSDNRRLQARVFHFIKGSIQSLANILVRWIRKFMNQSDEHSVSRELGFEDIPRGYVAWETTGTFDFDAVLKNADLHICCNAVVAVKDGVCDDFM